MIILDTNVVSELMKAQPEPKVVKRVDSFDEQQVFITSISKAEILYGIEKKASGQKSRDLAVAAAIIFDQEFNGRILPFDENSAVHYARIKYRRQSLGRRIEEPDALIAAICRQHRFAIVTRDTDDFADCDIDVIDPRAD